MLLFKVFDGDAPARSVNLEGAYLVGADRVPMRTEMTFADGVLKCHPKGRGAAALSILWPVQGLGRIMLETTRLPERKEPYNLHVELARGQLLRISQKREDWGLYDFTEGEALYREVDAARNLLVTALTAPDEATAAQRGAAATAASVQVAERMGIFHADVFLKRRCAASQFAKHPLGCRLEPSECTEHHIRRLLGAFDFACLPFRWRALEPKKGKYDAGHQERAVRVLQELEVPIRGSALLSFEKPHVPKWLPKAAKDYDQLRECVARHIKSVLQSFGRHVQVWEVAKGIHAYNPLHLTFEQLMELTRMSSLLAKQLSPKSRTIVGIALPWGEYYASNPRTIPPLLYADMVVQGGVNFDAFGIEILFACGESGAADEGGGLFVRNLMQVSSMLDQFGGFGKPLHVTAAGVPSGGGRASDGCWHGEWSEARQAEWVREFYRIALSKPFVETITWHALTDTPGHSAQGGVVRPDLSVKPAYEEILSLRRDIFQARSNPASPEARNVKREA